jgi:hypothetical protein
MTWNNDGHGLVCKIPEAKLYRSTHSWAMKLSQLHKQGDAMVRVATYSLNAEMAGAIFARRPHHIRVLCNARFLSEAKELMQMLPGVEVQTRTDLHAKLVLIEPATVYLGSANFVNNALNDVSVGLRSRAAHDHYAQWFDETFEEATVTTPKYTEVAK